VKAKNDREHFFKKLKTKGYIVKTKPVTSVYDYTKGGFNRKCNFDVEITIIALDKLSDYQELVLCSGDGDFIKLIKYAKGKFRKTTVMAHKHRLNSELEITANKTIFFETLKPELEKKKGLP